MGQYDVLVRLARAPERALRMSDLAEQVLLSPSGLTRLVDRIEAEGLLERRRCATDRRGYEAALTPQGTAMLRRMWPVYAGVLNRHVAAMLNEDEALAVATGLGRVNDSVRPDRHPAVAAGDV